MKNDLLKNAKREQKKINALTAAAEKSAREKRDAKNLAIESMRDKCAELENAFKQLNGIPLDFYKWSSGRNEKQWNAHQCEWHTVDFSFTRMYGSHSNWFDAQGGGRGANFSIVDGFYGQLIQSDLGGFSISLTRDIFSKDEIGDRLNIGPDRCWSARGNERIESQFYGDNCVEKLVEHVEAFLPKIIHIEKYEKEINQTETKNILAEYLKIDAEKIEVEKSENENGYRFKIGEQSYRVLKPKEVEQWHARYVELTAANFFDAELLASNSKISALEWHALKNAIGIKALNSIIQKTVSVEAYGREYAKRYSFEKYCVPFKNIFVVDCKKLDSPQSENLKAVK